jgi:uncharacterized protein YjbJ (UPF0337 family)
MEIKMSKKLIGVTLTLALFALAGNVCASTGKADPKADAANKAETSAIFNKDVIAGKWKQLKGKIQQKWAKVTHDDVLKMEGTATELEGVLQQKYGFTKEDAEKSIQEFLAENKAYLDQEEKQ